MCLVFLTLLNSLKFNPMKNLLFILITVSLLIGCTVNSKMNASLNEVYPGMTISDFKAKVTKSSLVQMSDNFVCYKLVKSNAKFGEPGGFVYQTRFFYFRDNKLYRIDEGTRATDLKIEIAKYKADN